MKKVLKYLFRTICSFILLLVIYLLAVVLLPLIPINNKQIVSDQDTVEIYILTNGMHTDIVVPVETEEINWSTIIPFSDTKSKEEKKLIAFGWGDKGFYLDTPEWKDLKFSTAFKAAFWLGSSAMHTTFYNSLTEGEDCKKIMITKEEYKNLVKYIKSSFLYNQQDKVEFIPTEMVYGNNDSFYEAVGTYNIFFTCNTWASDALKSANQRAPLWTATQQGIFRYY